jgi:hypothetical protein
MQVPSVEPSELGTQAAISGTNSQSFGFWSSHSKERLWKLQNEVVGAFASGSLER